LTAQGRRFREHVDAMAAAALRAEAAVSASGRQARGAVKLSMGATLAAHWLMPRMERFLREHDHLQIEIITHPFPASVRRREADVVLRPVDAGEENLVGRLAPRTRDLLPMGVLDAGQVVEAATADDPQDGLAHGSSNRSRRLAATDLAAS
jgi:DNA-binding transcriptional LysR family regulator